MIKNLLYSLFLHFLLLTVIYANFNLRNIEENKTSEIAVSLISLNGSEDSSKTKLDSALETKEKLDSKKERQILKNPKSQKESPKNKVTKHPEKLAKSKPSSSIAKPVIQEKNSKFKQEITPEKIQEESDKNKKDEVKNEEKDEEENNILQKEKNLGSKEKFDEEQESDEQKNPVKSDQRDMANSIENINLSAREKFNIQSQLKMCYRRAIDETKLSSTVGISAKLNISEDGYIESDLEDLIDMARYNNPKEAGYKISVDNVRRAIDLCSPLRNLPLEKYEIWKEIILEFNDENKS
jgi:outer membrane biosynthesis protein TonB